MKEITSGLSLYEEGEDMHHCVFSYAENCIVKNCFIFSVSCTYENNDKEERISTIEISKNMEIFQTKGKHNSPIDKKTENIINIWAKENHIVWNNKYMGIFAA
jgi:hypothetical protein